MNKNTEITNYSDAIKAIKLAILQSRYRIAVLANKEMLSLYYGIGKYVSENSRSGFWGTNSIEQISNGLQKELPGLRGFSSTNIKRMRIFYEEWKSTVVTNKINRPIPLGENEQQINNNIQIDENEYIIIRPIASVEFSPYVLDCFTKVGFSHHYEIIRNIKSLTERLFYIEKCANEFWSFEKLQYNLKSDLYHKQGISTNNFTKTISEKDLRGKALRAFKDEYLLDYVNIEDPDEEDERVIENQIVRNIKKFILTLGNGFSFIDSQHRLVVAEKEFFIDLLFYNRKLQCLVAIELKRGEFKPEYVGKLNFYLSALDEYEKLPNENPSIGIILCKSQEQKIVEFAFKDTSKPMGVATYKTYNEIPDDIKKALPPIEELKKLL
jgi:predicted nuclease of restriction endonuclease-like (RecB) superfamily